jgi:isoquinoline 1-oxidoreductase subunit beta
MSATARGDVDLATACAVTEATYQVPSLAHASMEPVNCTVPLFSGGHHERSSRH